jgi:hypothetical protein
MQVRYLGDRLCVFMAIGSLATGAGCGGVNSGHRPPDAAADSSAAPPDSPPPDAAPVPRCDPAKPFGTPTLVANVNSAMRDQGAQLVDDLTIYFGSDRSSPTGLYTATRSSPTSLFGTPVPLQAINATGAATGPALTGDGLTMYYALVATGQTSGDIYVTSRSSKTSAFPAGTLVAGLNSTLDDLDPFVTEDGSALYFDSARGSTALHLYVAVRQADGSFGTPQALTNLNTNVTDGHPVLTHDGLRLYWSSPRTDGGALGGTDIWTAARPSTAGSFGTPVRVPELSSSNNESVSWISQDTCVAYLQSDRPGGLGLQDIYQAVKPM